nr:reverse transcriptase domain-containing protein [Tanacetum cinerariifolium]
MLEDFRVPIILGRPFLVTTRAMIDVFNKNITLRVGDDEVIFEVNQSIKRPSTEDDECYSIDDLDETINAEAQELLANDESDSFLLRGLEKSIDQSDLESCESFENKDDDDSDPEGQIRPSANEIDKKKPELKDLPHHLEYAYLCGFFQILIAPEDQENTTFTCPYETFAYQRMSFGLCNTPATFQRCMMEIFHDMVEDFMEVFMDDFSVFGFDIKIKDKRGAENLAADHLSRLENPDLGTFMEDEITNEFPDKHLMILKADGHHSAPVTGRKVYESGFFWSSIFKDAKDYVKAQALPTNDARVVIMFLRRLFVIFGVPKALISDRGTHFCNSQLEKALQKYEVTHKLSTAYHPQTNRQTEVTNKAIKRILERSVRYNPKNWSEKLDDALWAFKTAYKTPTRCTPFRLVYEKACHLHVEIEHKAYLVLKQCNIDLTATKKNRFMELNELIELRDDADENTRIDKERTKRCHDSRLHGDKNFKVGDKVLLFNSRFKMHPNKLKSKWYGLNVVNSVYPYGTVKITNKNEISFKVNGQRLKKYHDRHIDAEDKEVVKFEEDTT